MKRNNSSPTSKPTSVDEQIKEIHYESISRFKEAGYLEQGNTDDVVAKINRLIVESQITAIRALKAERHESDGMCNSGFYIDAEDRDKLLAALNKELGDSEAEKNSGTWSRV